MSRKAVPSVLNNLHGNPGKRKRKTEPKPETLLSYPLPEWFKDLEKDLQPIVRKEWEFMSEKLKALNLLTEIDMKALEAYCVCYATWQNYVKKTNSELIYTSNGSPMLSPYNKAAQSYYRELRVWLNEFGLTPASRVRLGGLGKDEEDAFKEFLEDEES